MFSINSETWKIVSVSPHHPKLLRSNGTYTVAVCDDITKKIYISKEITNPQFFKKVLCHEITHAAMFSYNVNLTLEQEELLADLIATYGQEIIGITNKIFKRIRNHE